MLFADGGAGPMSAEFQAAHPDLRAVLVDLDHWSHAQRIQPPLINQIRRSAKANAEFYIKHFSALRIELLTSGALRHPADLKLEQRNRREMAQLLSHAGDTTLVGPVLGGTVLSPLQRTQATHLLSDAFIETESRARFSWHLVLCGADLRSYHYSRTEEDRVMAWLHQKCGDAQKWELLKDMVAGPCIHLARKDSAWAQQHKADIIHGGNTA